MHHHFVCVRDGGLAVITQEAPTPLPGPGQLLVRVRAAGLNRGEILTLRRSGSSELTSLGIEAAGEVLAAGPESGPFVPGARVMGRCKGAFADCVLMDVNDAMPVPDTLSWIEAGAVPIAFLVAHDMLIGQGRLTAGEWVLITGVSSGVGVATLQLAKALGAHVIGTSGSRAKLADLTALGLDHGIPTRAPDFCETVLAATRGHGADLVVNIVGGSVLAESIRCMAFRGRLATVGYLDGVTSAPLDLAAVHRQRLQLFGVSSKLLDPIQRHLITQGVVRDILPLFAMRRLRPVIAQAFSFADLATAIARLESGTESGKIVVSDEPAS